jgi:hypothetical protein
LEGSAKEGKEIAWGQVLGLTWMCYKKRHIAAFALGLAYMQVGCAAGPSTAGFAHTDPMPYKGHEISAGINGGLLKVESESEELYGGEVSYAANLESAGLSVAGWIESIASELLDFGGHIELALPFLKSV